MRRGVSEKIRECRRECGYTQQMVATALNVDRTTYTCYESGKTEPSIDSISQMSKIFGVSINELLACYEDNAPTVSVASPGSSFRTGEGEGMSIRLLSKDEKEFIMLYRMMGEKEREELLKKGKALFNKMMEDDG
ncbi:MAG: helix-turn-helix domain-containing protein [Clostridia bacterium]|nr:helix-turn-helix domain-containing protein [Clostridia bacterium]